MSPYEPTYVCLRYIRATSTRTEYIYDIYDILITDHNQCTHCKSYTILMCKMY